MPMAIPPRHETFYIWDILIDIYPLTAARRGPAFCSATGRRGKAGEALDASHVKNCNVPTHSYVYSISPTCQIQPAVSISTVPRSHPKCIVHDAIGVPDIYRVGQHGRPLSSPFFTISPPWDLRYPLPPPVPFLLCSARTSRAIQVVNVNMRTHIL